MSVPPFNKQGDLPVGVHTSSLPEALARFGSLTPTRQRLALRLERIYQLAAATGHLGRFIVFGSFVTAKLEPNDVDVFMLMENSFAYEDTAGETRLLFDNPTAQSYFGCSVFWVRRLAALEGEQATIEYWQAKRDGTQRGIIEIVAEDI